MSFPRYPAYKDSGVEWLGAVPSHWIGPRKLGDISSLKGRLGWQGLKAEEYRDEGPFVVSSAHFSDFKIRWQECPHVSWERYEIDANIQLSVEDILLMKDGAALGKLAFVDELPDAACLNSHLLLFRPLQFGETPTYAPKFAFYYMQTSLFQEFMQTRGTGATFMGVSQETLARHQIYWPQLDEQRTIATFLNHETTKIDALVTEQEMLIELLKEKRQAVISHAVTKGLDPSVPMKDSGVEWLGEVPAHWEVRSISSISTKITNGYVGPTRDILVDDGVRYLQSLHIKGNKIRFDHPYYVREDWSLDHRKSILETGDVLIVQTGDIGQTAVVPAEFAGCNCHALIIVSPVRDVLTGNWLASVLTSDYGFHSLLSIQTGALHPHLNCGNVKFLTVPVPPRDEQESIQYHITERILQFDDLIREAGIEIELLRERRTSLISAAVTGQIDVRGFAQTEAA